MARSPGQSDFVVYPARAPSEPTETGELPQAPLRSSEASATATRWVMRLTWIMLAALLLLCLIGPHIPSGE